MNQAAGAARAGAALHSPTEAALRLIVVCFSYKLNLIHISLARPLCGASSRSTLLPNWLRDPRSPHPIIDIGIKRRDPSSGGETLIENSPWVQSRVLSGGRTLWVSGVFATSITIEKGACVRNLPKLMCHFIAAYSHSRGKLCLE